MPVESSFADLSEQLEVYVFKTDSFTLKASVYIDNLYTLSCSSNGATRQMELLLDYLRSQWGLVAKLGSKRILATKGADTSTLVGSGWIVEAVSEVLGHCIQCDGGISRGWAKMVSKMWGAFYANVRAPSWRRLGTHRRLTLVDRCIKGLASFYAAIIPPQHH